MGRKSREGRKLTEITVGIRDANHGVFSPRPEGFSLGFL